MPRPALLATKRDSAGRMLSLLNYTRSAPEPLAWVSDMLPAEARTQSPRQAPEPAAPGEDCDLLAHLERERAGLAALAARAAALRAEADAQESQAAGMRLRHQLRRATELRERAAALRAEAAELEKRSDAAAFEANAEPYVRMYKRRRFFAKDSDCRDILEAYRLQRDDEPGPLRVVQEERCGACDLPLKLCAGTATLVCPKCGAAQQHIEAPAGAVPHRDDATHHCYAGITSKRIAHWLEWLRHVQGSETTEMPPQVLAAVRARLAEQQVAAEAAEVQQVREALRALKLRKWYKHAPAIAGAISGRLPPRLGKEQEEKLNMMFVHAWNGFQSVCGGTRQNFLSYSYVFRQLALILGLDGFVPHCVTLRSPDKLARADAIWHSICDRCGWAFVPLRE